MSTFFRSRNSCTTSVDAGPGVRRASLETEAALEEDGRGDDCAAIRDVPGVAIGDGALGVTGFAGVAGPAAPRFLATTTVSSALIVSHCFTASGRGAKNVNK
jgi:hypothetical protein